jgi:HK97 family phage portal protein
MNTIQKAIAWMFQKAIGFPAWNVSSQMPSEYSRFFRETNAVDAMQRIATVYNCCNLIGRRVSTLPIDIVESRDGISVPVANYVTDLLRQPNEYMNQVVFFETMLLALNLRGNAYAEIVRSGNRITALWPINPDRVVPDWNGVDLVYRITLPDGKIAIKKPGDIWHLRNFSFDGIHGITPLCLHAISKSAEASEMYRNMVRQGARPSLALSSPKDPSDEAKKALRQSADSLYSGPENVGKIMFLFGGTTAVPLSITPADAKLLEMLGMDNADIAAAYGVPLMLLNRNDAPPTYASAEQFNRQLVDYTFDPLCVRIDISATENLLNPRLSLRVKHNLDALLAGDSMGRANYLRTLVAAGLMTPNEGRSKLNLPPKPGGDDLITQSNQAPLQLLEQMNTAPDPVAPADPTKQGKAIINWKPIEEVAWRAKLPV